MTVSTRSTLLKESALSVRILCFSFCILFAPSLLGQDIDVDELSIVKMWSDLNGENRLVIHLEGACNNYDNQGAFLKDNEASRLTVELVNEENDVKVRLEKKPLKQASYMIYDEGIWFAEEEDMQAVFIPVFYCTPFMTNEMIMTYIVLYNGRSYVYHFSFNCQTDVLGKCSISLSKSKLERLLADLPKKLSQRFTKYLQKTYSLREDIFPNHLIFRTEKYTNVHYPYELVTTYKATYPHVLLDNVNDYLAQEKYTLAATYLKEFEYVFVNAYEEVDVAGFYIQNRTTALNSRQLASEKEQLLEEALALTRRNDYQEAYLIYKYLLTQVDTE